MAVPSFSYRSRTLLTGCVLELGVFVVGAVLSAPASAQVAGKPVGADSGPVSEMSRNLKRDSGPVFGDGGPVHGLSVESRSDGPVRGSVTGTVRGGAVKDMTVGSVGTRLPPGFYASEQRQAAAELHIEDREDAAPPLLAEPISDLRPLAEILRSIEPLPEHQPAEPDAAGEEFVQADEVQVPQVENPDGVDPTQLTPPAEPEVEGPGGVFMPAPPKVGAPSEVVPIPMPGSTPEPDYD